MLRLETYKLFAATGIIGFLYGIIVFNDTIEIALHDTLIIIDERHMVIVVCSLFMLFSLIYFWLLKLNKPVNEKLGKIHFILTILSLVAGIMAYQYIQSQTQIARYTPGNLEWKDELTWSVMKYFQAIVIMFAVAQIAFFVNVVTTVTKKSNGIS